MTEQKITYRGVIYPWQCDAMGHFTTRHYMAMFDEAAWHFLYEFGFNPAIMTEKKIGWADVRHQIEYLKELHQGDLVIIEGIPVSIGTKSIEYQLDMKSVNHDEICASLLAKTVQFDLTTRRAIPVLPQVRERFLASLE